MSRNQGTKNFFLSVYYIYKHILAILLHIVTMSEMC